MFGNLPSVSSSRFNLCLNKHDSLHAHLTFFVNGANAGEIHLRLHEAQAFTDILRAGAREMGYEFELTGPWRDLYGK